MPRGGRRNGTPKPSWNAGKTTVVRVPIALKDTILNIARAFDELESEPVLVDKDALKKAQEILIESLTLPANKGGAIKNKIREVLALLDES
jgi:hypothetical protein